MSDGKLHLTNIFRLSLFKLQLSKFNECVRKNNPSRFFHCAFRMNLNEFFESLKLSEYLFIYILKYPLN